MHPVSASLQDRVIEYVDHLHEHIVDPVVVSRDAYRVPAAPGFSSRLRPESLARYSYLEGSE
jgi:L-fuconate dehydratase